MAFVDTFNAFRSGTAIKNPIAALVSQARPLVQSITSVTSSTSVTQALTLLTNTQSKIDELNGKIRIQLPIMTSADNIEKSLGIAEIESNGASKLFNNAFTPYSVAETQITELIALLTPEFIIAINNGNTEPTNLFRDKVNSMSSAISASFDTSNAAMADALGVLQADSYAKYVTSPAKPLYVDSVLTKIRNWPT